MEHQDELGDGLSAIERALSELAPAPARMSVARTMFLAGQEAAQVRTGRPAFWRGACAGLAALSLVLGLLAAWPRPTRIVYVPQDSPQREDVAPSTRLAIDTHDTRRVEDANDTPSLEHNQPLLASTAWLNPLSGLSWRQPALHDEWDTAIPASGGGEQVAVAAIRYRDWQKMVDDADSPGGNRPSPPSGLFDWKHLLPTRGL